MKKKMSILLSAALLGCAFPVSVHGKIDIFFFIK